MFRQIKKHYLAVILALVVGCLTSLPQILAVREVSGLQGIYKQINNDELYYLARARDVIDGHSKLANPYLYEHKDNEPLQFWLPDYILAKPLDALKIKNIHYGYLFYDFFLPLVLTLLTYSAVYSLINSRIISLLSAAFLHLNLFFHWFNRPVSPQFNFIFWLLLYLFWLRFLRKPSYVNAILAGIIFGFLFYVYTYYWTFYAVFFAVFLAINFILKKSVDYKKYFLILGIAFIISIPYFISMVESFNLPYYSETLARVGMVDTHFPTGRKIVMWGLIVLIFMAFFYWKKIVNVKVKSLLLFSGVLAAVITTNQNIITGKNLQFASHYWMLSVFIFIFTFAYLIKLWLGNVKARYIKILFFILVSIYIFYSPAVYALSVLKGEALKYNKEDIKKQEYAPAFNWLNKNTQKDEVVFANMELSSLIPVYTSNNVYSNGLAGLHFMSNKELQERFVINNFWDEMDADYAIDHKFGIWGSYHQTAYDINRTKNKLRKLFFLSQVNYEKIPQKDIENFLRFAREIQSKDFKKQLKKYRADYLIWDKNVDKNWPIESLDFLRPIAEINNVAIYKIE